MSINNTNLFTAIKHNSLDKVSRLLLRNIDNLNEYIDQRGINNENTPLIFAILEEHFDIAKLLIYAGADIEKVDIYKWTPLHFACGIFNYDLANLLVECGADVNAKENEGRTPLDIMFLGRRKQKMSGDPSYKENLDNTNKIASLLLKHGGEVKFYNQFESYISYKKNDKCNINADAIFNLGIANESRNTKILAERLSKKLINSDPTVRAAMKLRNSTLSIENTTMLYQDSKLINDSFYPEITGKSSNIPNIGAIVSGVFSVIIVGGMAFLGKKLYDYYRSCNTYGWKNNRNAMIQLLPKQGQDNLAFITLNDATVSSAEDNQGVATTTL
ncbi:MAG: ankyrin repeat domain-containing protein [Wolbachia endosymbiont of Xenopsylla cheopis]